MTVLLLETQDKLILQHAFDFIAEDVPQEIDSEHLKAIRLKYKVT